jgi:hypothetical protein
MQYKFSNIFVNSNLYSKRLQPFNQSPGHMFNEKKRGSKISWHCPFNMGFMGIKRRRILQRFQKYKLTSVTKLLKNSSRLRIFVCSTLFSVCKILRLSPHCRKKIWTLIVDDPKSHDLCDRGQLTQFTCFAIFHAFTRGTTDLCFPFVKNVKSTHPNVYFTYHIIRMCTWLTFNVTDLIDAAVGYAFSLSSKGGLL